jgi:N-acetylglucosamine-6-sulfatase
MFKNITVFALLATTTANAKDSRPNILFVFSDDHAVPQHFGVPTDTHKLMYFPKTSEWNLFDLNNEPNEMKSVYHDASYKKIRNRLTKEFHRLRTVFEAPPLKDFEQK